MRVLLTGATGYVGGRILPMLEKAGYNVRCLVRRPEVLLSKVGPSTEVVTGDMLDRASLDNALRGIDAAYYLVHSMGSSGANTVFVQPLARARDAAVRAGGTQAHRKHHPCYCRAG